MIGGTTYSRPLTRLLDFWSGVFRNGKVRSGTALLWVLLSSLLPANSSKAEQLFELRILSTEAEVALKELSRQTGHSVIYQSIEVENIRTNQLIGRYSLKRAVDCLLKGTDLSGGLTRGGVITVSLANLTDEAKRENKTMAEKNTAKMDVRKGVFASMMAFLLGSGGAQNAVAQVTDNDRMDNRPVMEEILVTATKRETSLQETPLSITALGSATMARQGIENFEDFSRQVPGLILSGTKNSSKFTIRGISTSTTSSSNGEQKPVAVYIDEVPVSSFSVLTPDLRLFDIERVEVLRGPQGTAFGSGSMGGGVRVITRKAQLDGYDASVRVDGGTTSGGGTRQRYSAMGNVPLIDDELALRVVGYYRDEEGYVENVGAWGFDGDDDLPVNKDWGMRASMRWEPSEDLSATLMLMHDDAETMGTDWFDPALGTYKHATFLTEETLAKLDSINLTVEYEFDWATLVSSTSYAEADLGFTIDLNNVLVGIMPLGFSVEQEQSAIVQEFRLVSNTEGSVEWMAGIFYLDRETDIDGSTFTPQSFLDGLDIDASELPLGVGPAVSTSRSFRTVENTESAIFGELTYHFSDTWSITGGLRYTAFEYSDVNDVNKGFVSNTIPLVFQSTFTGIGGTALSSPGNSVDLSTGTQNATTTKLVLSWEPHDNALYYMAAAEGFRRDHPNNGANLPSVVDPTDPTIIPEVADSDSLWNYELGMKNDWMDGRVQTNIAAYFIIWDDIQISATRSSDSLPFTANAGDAETMGIEAEILAWPTPALQLGFSLTVADSEIVSLDDLDAITSGAVEGASLAAPDLQASGFAQYNWDLDNGQSVFARLDVQYVGEYPNGQPNTPGSATQEPNPNFEEIPSYTNTNAQLGWESDRIALALYGENILDNDDYRTINPANSTIHRYRTLRPRTIGLRLDWKL